MFKGKGTMKSYVFKAVIEDDSFHDGKKAFYAYCPALNGAYTWGYTKEEAIKNLQEVVEMVVECMIEDGEPLPAEDKERTISILPEPLVVVNV